MKIVNKSTFLELPTGTVYCKYFDTANFEGLYIKYSSIYNDEGVAVDWNFADITSFDNWNDSNELFEKCELMKNKGKEFPMLNNSTKRDGLFEKEELFGIYDKEDVTSIITTLTNVK